MALTFGTLLSSQGTDASFGPVSPGPSGRFPSVLAFPTLSDSFVSDSRSKRDPAGRLNHHHAFQFFAFAFPFPASPTLSGLFPLLDRGPASMREHNQKS
ncbi:hypothetical protein EAO74_34670 [Streptomyces sp. gb1(2016)]|uniref:Uncharacterized protein n=1 Tax=Streptomyces sp. gb1(2016) TaxID=1828321 RepID=A0A652KQU0_9ACTN|nr:hypothetical protein EAO74_34670 [Streptomyces sp. gb1(2016)]